MDAHATYLVVAIVSNDGGLIQKPLRIQNTEAARMLELLETHRVSDVLVEASTVFDPLDVLCRVDGMKALLQRLHSDNALPRPELWSRRTTSFTKSCHQVSPEHPEIHEETAVIKRPMIYGST